MVKDLIHMVWYPCDGLVIGLLNELFFLPPQGLMQRTKVFFGLERKSTMDLKVEVKELMFSTDKEKDIQWLCPQILPSSP